MGISALRGAVTGVAFGAVGKAVSGSMSVTTRLANYSRRAIQAQKVTRATRVVRRAAPVAKKVAPVIKKVTQGVCFIAGTLVLTEHGKTPIEQVKVGEHVYCENPETGEKGLKKVVQTFVHETSELIDVKVDGQNIVATPEHPFWVSKKGWINAIDLQIGDIFSLQGGNCAKVEQIKHKVLSEPVTVYNFEVEDFHTYYVGNSGVLVHNACGGMNNLRTLRNTTIRGYNVSMDLERGGSKLLNIHLKVGNTKYFYKGGKFINSAGREIPNVLRNNATIKNALNKALYAIKRGF